MQKLTKLLKEEKAQTSIEYLLTISIAIMLSAVVFAVTLQTAQIVDFVDNQTQTFRRNAIRSAAE